VVNKLNLYRDELIKFMALCEGAGLFSTIAFFLIGDYRLLIITGIAAIAMISKLPTAKKLVNTLNLDWKEQQELL
jgi:hypothetical protein